MLLRRSLSLGKTEGTDGDPSRTHRQKHAITETHTHTHTANTGGVWKEPKRSPRVAKKSIFHPAKTSLK